MKEKDFFEQHVNPDCIREEDCGLWIVYQDGKPCGAVFDGHAKASGEVCTEYQALYGWTGATKGNLIGYAPTVQEAADLAVRTILTMRESRRTVYAAKLRAAQSKLEAALAAYESINDKWLEASVDDLEYAAIDSMREEKLRQLRRARLDLGDLEGEV